MAFDEEGDAVAERLEGSIDVEIERISDVEHVGVTGPFVPAPPSVGEWVAFDATNTTISLDALAVPRGPLAPPPGVFLDTPITHAEDVRFLVDGSEVAPVYERDAEGYIWALWLPRRVYPFGATISLVSAGYDFAGRPRGGPPAPSGRGD